jgi:hypothetical protein
LSVGGSATNLAKTPGQSLYSSHSTPAQHKTR